MFKGHRAFFWDRFSVWDFLNITPSPLFSDSKLAFIVEKLTKARLIFEKEYLLVRTEHEAQKKPMKRIRKKI